jgi:hypothetical protein
MVHHSGWRDGATSSINHSGVGAGNHMSDAPGPPRVETVSPTSRLPPGDASITSCRLSFALGCALLAASCIDGPLAPLRKGVPVNVTLTTTFPDGSAQNSQQIFLVDKRVEVSLDMVSGPCLLFNATGSAIDGIVQIEIESSGDPRANCAPGTVVYHQVMLTDALASGRYDVRVFDHPLGDRARLIVRSIVESSNRASISR